MGEGEQIPEIVYNDALCRTVARLTNEATEEEFTEIGYLNPPVISTRQAHLVLVTLARLGVDMSALDTMVKEAMELARAGESEGCQYEA